VWVYDPEKPQGTTPTQFVGGRKGKRKIHLHAKTKRKGEGCHKDQRPTNLGGGGVVVGHENTGGKKAPNGY